MGSANPSVYASGSGASLYATVTWGAGPEVTVNVSSTASWKMVPRGSSGHSGILSSAYATDSYSNTFIATDGDQYVFQVYDAVEGTYYNQDFATSGFTVDFSDDSGGGESGGGEDTSASAHTLHINQGEGTIIKVQRTWSDFGATGYLSDGDTVYYPADRFQITAEPLEGYEIDYYDSDDGEHLPFMMDNLTKPYDGEPYQLLYAADATISATATPIATVHIYNQDDSSWGKYALYVYSNDSGWNRYAPFVYNGSSWNRYS